MLLVLAMLSPSGPSQGSGMTFHLLPDRDPPPFASVENDEVPGIVPDLTKVATIEAPFAAWKLILMVGRTSLVAEGFLEDFDRTAAAVKPNSDCANLVRRIRRRFR